MPDGFFLLSHANPNFKQNYTLLKIWPLYNNFIEGAPFWIESASFQF